MIVHHNLYQRHDVFTCEVDYDLPLRELVTKERMGTLERERVFESLDEYKDKPEQTGKRTLEVGLLKPVRDTILQTLRNNVRHHGRAATLREVIVLCRSYPRSGLKQRTAVIVCHSPNQQSIPLAYWFDGAWRLTALNPRRIWRRTYTYKFAYVLR